ncbi:hypothetical protein HDU92_000416 [Lobulomyces angularis]|nr:hypothetical protein HDU92_000416 [Lobulomyces angularis]
MKRVSFTEINPIQTFNKNDSPKELLGWKVKENSFNLPLPATSDIVKLSNIRLNKGIVTGYVLVKNLAFQKEILVRYTTNNWKTYHDTKANFNLVSYNNFDSFTFAWNLDQIFSKENVTGLKENKKIGQKKYLEDPTLIFCIKYTANSVDEYWDNNCGSNYCLKFTAPTVKQNIFRTFSDTCITAIPSVVKKSFKKPIISVLVQPPEFIEDEEREFYQLNNLINSTTSVIKAKPFIPSAPPTNCGLPRRSVSLDTLNKGYWKNSNCNTNSNQSNGYNLYYPYQNSNLNALYSEKPVNNFDANKKDHCKNTIINSQQSVLNSEPWNAYNSNKTSSEVEVSLTAEVYRNEDDVVNKLQEVNLNGDTQNFIKSNLEKKNENLEKKEIIACFNNKKNEDENLTLNDFKPKTINFKNNSNNKSGSNLSLFINNNKTNNNNSNNYNKNFSSNNGNNIFNRQIYISTATSLLREGLNNLNLEKKIKNQQQSAEKINQINEKLYFNNDEDSQDLNTKKNQSGKKKQQQKQSISEETNKNDDSLLSQTYLLLEKKQKQLQQKLNPIQIPKRKKTSGSCGGSYGGSSPCAGGFNSGSPGSSCSSMSSLLSLESNHSHSSLSRNLVS